ncbi:hypothetical protein Cst04h_19530 [Corynebacterium striatum]|uniref:FCS-type domain-containing protein n=1 Tax=Corynebacterium striatum TaxID=43770 RepID=A0ABC9ZNW9_CORST|nr:hypothetical protein Cst04h_19530 [Corynebacterium striatum]GKH17099.1 hypothetical protein CE91St29_14120 [Corynebacterium striatum]
MIRQASRDRAVASCQWCGKEIPQGGRGRPRKFCSASCKQRAYEQRNNVSGTSIPKNAVIMTPERADELRDGLFELRCSAEDVAMAAKEGADGDELQELCSELVALARRLEELR